jgi:hypothetical protein
MATELGTGWTPAPLLPGEKGLGDEGKPRIAGLIKKLLIIIVGVNLALLV